jgi:hypothetical protein
MEIQSFKLFVTDDDLAALTAKMLRDHHDSIEELKVRLTPEGVVLQGEYPTTFFKVPFETVWQFRAAGPMVQLSLSSVKVAGLPGGILRGALMKMVRDAVSGEKGIEVRDETISIHVADVARAQGVELRVHFTAVRMSIGSAVLEAGSVP